MTEDLLELDVGAVAHGGHCVARTSDGQVVFVRHALPGERVRAVVTEERRGFLRADAVEVLRGAPGRVVPPCPWAGPDRCGGCDFQHASLELQRELKTAVVREQLARLGGFAQEEIDGLGFSVEALPDVPGESAGLGWRTRVQYTVDADGRAGLLKHRSYEVVDVDRCRIAHPAAQAAPVLDRRWSDADGVEVVVSAAGQATIVERDGRNRRIVAGPSRVTEHTPGREWSIPANVFWQVHPAAAQALSAIVVELLAPRPGERAWDLYGGVGLFAAALASALTETGRIALVEADRRAVDAARQCLRDLPSVRVVHADVERALGKGGPVRAPVDLVVLDPPRAGAGRSVVTSIIKSAARAVAYVACDPAALARDLRTFREAGWQLTHLRGFDLFPMTHHVECVALLTPKR